ncbi:MAG TPA: type II toxin-antitoxin system PemK/MazF family toxin [Micromonospora sp.]|nr:type II toxin-antitoxin system PemK/MazF family toxin [Micromonospora sp.]
MTRGEVWIASRAGRDRLVVIVGHNAVTDARTGVLVVPLSDVRASTLIEPSVALADGHTVGIAMTPRVGEIDKAYLTERRGTLHPDSIQALDIALRAVLGL